MPINWGYVLNQAVRRRDVQERALKQVSVCGFRGVELRAGSGRFSPFGRPDLIELGFGTVHNFVDFAHSCNIDQIVSYFYDPATAFLEESSNGRSASNPADHAGVVESIRPFAKFIHDVGGSHIVVKAMASYGREAPVTDAKIKTVGECWNKVGKMTQEFGIKTTMHTDCLGAIHGAEDIAKLLDATDPKLVGFTMDTGDLTVAGVDPVALYEKFYSRVDYLHFKDAAAVDSLQEYKTPAAGSLLSQGGQRNILRWFYPMGSPGGLVKFPALMESLKKHNYQGWIMAESEQHLNAAEACMLNSWYMKNVLAKA